MDKAPLNYKHFFLLLLLVHHCVGPPTKNKEPTNQKKEDNKSNLDDFGLEYNRYLSEVVNALESDPDFRKKLETADEADFRSGKVAAELEYVNHRVRSKLDELKRTELQRLRDLVKQEEELENNAVNKNQINAGHVDHSNPHTFESADLHALITQVRLDLLEVDRKRREEFKEYELQKKFEQEQKIKQMDEEHKKQYLHELEEQKKKHQQHEPLHHPGSKAQLEEVWEKQDHMENQKFNPKTFFLLHDINGDGYWDEDEVKALFVKELDKLYQAGVPEDDMREREEEMERMREHVFKESDMNGDRLISYQEFLEQTKKQEFNRDEGWESIDAQQQFSQQEYEEFERRRQEEIQRLIDQGLLQPPPGMHPGYAAHPGQQYQQQYGHPGMVHPNQIPQQYGQNAYHPQGMPQHQQGMPQYPQGMPQQHPQGVPQQHPQGMPQQHPQGMPQQHPQGMPQQHPQGMPQQHPQGVPQNLQAVPAQPQYGHAQYVAQQYGHPQQPPAPAQNNPSLHAGQHPQQNQQALPHPNSLPDTQKQPPQYGNQPSQNIPQQQSVHVAQNQAPISSSSNQQPPQQQYHQDPNQIVANQVNNHQAPSSNNQLPPSNQPPNQQFNQVPQAQTGQQPSAGSYQQASGGNNKIHSDTNKVQNNVAHH